MSDKLSPGSKVIITTGNGSIFTGVLHSFDESLGKIILKKVSTSGSRLCGLQNFYFSDMTKLQIIKETPQSSTERTSLPNNNEGNDFMSKHTEMSVPHHLMEAETTNADESDMANIDGTDNGGNGWVYENGESELLDGNDDNSLLNVNDDNSLLNVNDDNSLLNVNDEYYEQDYYTLIYRLGDKFYEAIDYLMGQEAVGVTFEGVNIGRNGILSVVQISTETDVIAFYILELGKEAFVEGLQALFESSKIVKVIHDCRWISDMLHEQFKVSMANIFDTQVANSCVYRIFHNGDWPRYVESLPTCLVKHLKLQPEDVTVCKVKDGQLERPGQSPWLQRPLSKKLLSAAQKNVSYLTQLHQVLLNKMLYEFRMGVEIYMSHVRNMDGEVESCQKQGYLLPPIFWKIPKLVYLTFGDSKGQNGDKSDIQGKDLPAPERVFLSHNSVRPKPKESAYARDSEPQDKNVVKYDSEGNAYIVLDRSNINFWFNDTNPGRTDSFFNNHTVENGSWNLHGETLQTQSLDPQEDIGCGNVQDLSLPCLLQRSDVHSKTESQKVGDTQVQEFSGSDCCFPASINKHGEKNNVLRHEQAQFSGLSQRKSNADVGECDRNENNFTFSDITGESIKQNTSVQEQDQIKTSSDQCLPTHKNALSVERKDIVLPIENTSLTSEQPSSDTNCGIRRSKLWQMFCSNEVKQATELSSHTADLDSHLDTQDLLPKTIPDYDTDARRAMPKLIRVHHDVESDSGNDPDCRRAMPKLVRVHPESTSRKSLSESSDCDNTPGRSHSVDQLCTSCLSRSSHSQSPSSDSESSLAHQSYAELNISKGKDLDCSSFLPAGFDTVRATKKTARSQNQSHKSDTEYESSDKDFLLLSLEEDLCYIPMQGSLKCRQELPLGVTSFDFGDHLSDSECNVQPGENSRCGEDACQVSHADSISEDETLCQFQKSEVFQKVLRMASSMPFENLKSKLLPSKVSVCGK